MVNTKVDNNKERESVLYNFRLSVIWEKRK